VRAADPDLAGHVVRDGLRIGYETFGQGEPTILLLPTWTIVHSRQWKFQVPYLARHFRVVAFDGPGNGLSDRVTDPARYTADSYAADAVAVLDACGVQRAVVVGLSLGARYGVRLATLHPERVMALVAIGPSIPLVPPHPERSAILEDLFQPAPAGPVGWAKYNVDYWYRDYADFVEFFFSQVFNEPHSTKPREDTLGWGLEAGPEILEAEARARSLEVQMTPEEWLAGVSCPTLVIHGTRDRIIPHAAGEVLARLSGGTFVSLEGSGHLPNVRDPVKVNLLIRDFVERIRP
jgi:pimeloyl-ACP methyl ester carboxylesterase